MKSKFIKNLKAFIIREKPFLFIVLVAVGFLLTLNSNWKPTWDSATYITLGKSLIDGHGYKYMGYSHIKYPPVFPLLLSPIIGIFGYNYLLMRLMIVIMGIGSIGMTYWICRMFDASSEKQNRKTTSAYDLSSKKIVAFSVMLLSAVSYPLLFEATRILSDIPYMFFSFLALIFIYKYSQTERALNKLAVPMIIFILLSYFTRLVAVSLVAASISYLFWKARKESPLLNLGSLRAPRDLIFSFRTDPKWLNASKKAAFIGLIFIAFASSWAVRNRLLSNQLPSELREAMSYERELILVSPSAESHRIATLKDIYSRVKNNLDYYEGLMTDIISGRNVKSRVGIIIISIILLCGFLVRAIFNPTLIEFYTFFYFWIYLLWPSRQGERFLVPIIPFLFLYFLYFVKLVVDLIGLGLKNKKIISITRFSATAIVTLGLFYLNISPAIDTIKNEHQTPYYQGGTANYINAILWVKENTSKDSVIVTDRAPWVHLLSDRKAFTFPWISDTQVIIDFIYKNGVTHVIYVPWGYSKAYLMPTIKAYQDKFAQIAVMGDCVIYQFRP